MSVLHVHVTPSTTTTTTTCQTIDGFNECFISFFHSFSYIFFYCIFTLESPLKPQQVKNVQEIKKSNNVFTKIKMTFIPEVLRSA